MAKAYTGAYVQFCGHKGWFIADIFKIGTANVIRANGPVNDDNICRQNLDKITHTMDDFPTVGFWRPELGVFVVPAKQVKQVRDAAR